MMNAEAIARALGGAARSGRDWVCRCPAHEDRSPSLSVSQGDDGRLLVHCFAGCAARDVLAVLRERGLIAEGKNARRAGVSAIMRNISDTVAYNTSFGWSDRAERIWQKSIPIMGTPAEIYLHGRGCFIPTCADIRFLPARQS